jgi:predicted phage terminase large subunit-like protein
MKPLNINDAVELASLDGNFYSHYFFPKAFRQDSAPFHDQVWNILEDPLKRFVGIKMFRGSAKTTLLRSYISKRVAYGISRTILYVGISEDAAVKSLDWIRRAVEYNKSWTTAFGLEAGAPWSSTQLCIRHKTLGHEIRLLGMGVTGSTRGINIDDYRPDLIICDDIMDEENSHTAESRRKIKDLIGSLRHSLAPRSDSPEAKFVILQTPLDSDDAIEEAMNDPQYATIEISCFTKNNTESSWPARWSFEELMADKEAHIQRNQLSLWMREMEVKVISSELSHWKADWLDYYIIIPEPIIHFMGVDPTPPPSDSKKILSEIEQAKLDDAVVMDIGLYKGDVFLVDYYSAKSPNPEEFVNKIFEYYRTYRPRVVTVETTLFQRMLKWYIEQEMKRRQVFMRIQPFEGKQKKETRILQSVSGRASNGTIHVKKTQTAFIEQFTRYPQVAHDDLLDAFSLCLCGINPALESGYLDGEYSVIDEQVPALPNWRAAP